MDLSVLLEPKIDLPRLTEVLDGLGHEGRVHTIRGWHKKRQAEIFEAAKENGKIDFDFVVPPSTPPLTGIVHVGQNTVPVFSHFQKIFAKLPDGVPARVIGYNTGVTQPLIGPGYYVVRAGEGEHEGELAIDYTEVPAEKPADWPDIAKNEGGVPGLVFGNMIDYLRRVSSHVSIGRAYKGGKAMDAWFSLVRKDVS